MTQPIGYYTDKKKRVRPITSKRTKRGYSAKPKLVIRKDIKESRQANLVRGGFADVGIVRYVNKINEMGFETVASCSGLGEDHYGRSTGSYLSIVLPEDVVEPHMTGDLFELTPSKIKKPSYIKKLIKAGHEANWNAEAGKNMMFLPTVRFSMPTTKSVGMDAVMNANPDLVKAQNKVDRLLKDPSHTTDEFLKAIHERNAIKEEISKRYGGRDRSDAEKKQAWNRLVKSLEKVEKQAYLDIYAYDYPTIKDIAQKADSLGADNVDVRTADQIHRVIVSTKDDEVLRKTREFAEKRSLRSLVVRR